MISCRNDSMVCSCEAKDADEDLDNASTEAEDADEDHDDVSTEAANVDEDHEDRKHYNDESPYRNKCSHHYQRDYREDSFNDIFDIESADDDDEIESEDDEDGTETVSEDCWNDNNNSVILYSKPIVVGYAFGPKKMSTMGVVMAEASKTKLSASSYSTATSENTTSLFNSVESPHTAILPLICNAQSTKDCDNTIVNSENMQVTPDKSEPISPSHVYQSNDYPDESVCHSPNMQELARQRNDDWSVKKRSCAKKRAVNRRNAQCDDSITFTIDGRVIHDNNNAATSNLRSIVRRFRSSCSSVGSTTDDACSSTATGTFTASSQQTGTTCGARTSNSGSRKSHPYNNTGSSKERLIPVRVSFVPLDPGKSV